MRIVPVPDEWQARAFVVTDVDEPESWFDADAIPVGLPKRRHEWMLSRIAAIELARRRHEPPGLDRSPYLSFSHSGHYGAAARDTQPIGIDIEQLRPIGEKAARFFLTEEERAEALATGIRDALLHWWCAKEAAWKRLGGAVTTLRNVPLRLLEAEDLRVRFDRAETWRGEVMMALSW